MIYLSLAFGGKMRQNPRWIFYLQQTEELLQFDAGRDAKRCVVILLTLGHKNLLHFITTTTTNKDQPNSHHNSNTKKQTIQGYHIPTPKTIAIK
jgi:hypothetical protein